MSVLDLQKAACVISGWTWINILAQKKHVLFLFVGEIHKENKNHLVGQKYCVQQMLKLKQTSKKTAYKS